MVELVRMDDATVQWLFDRFRVQLLALEDNALVDVAERTPAHMAALLASGRFYCRDIAAEHVTSGASCPDVGVARFCWLRTSTRQAGKPHAFTLTPGRSAAASPAQAAARRGLQIERSLVRLGDGAHDRQAEARAG